MNVPNNPNNLCRVCLERRPQTEMLSVNQSQLEKLLFIGDSNKIIRFNGQPPNLCIECGIHLDSVYDFIVKLRMNTLQMKKQEQTKLYNSPNYFIERTQSNQLTLPCVTTVQNVSINCKKEPNPADYVNLQRQTVVPYDPLTIQNVVVHCKIEPAELEMSQLQPNSNVVSQSHNKVESELDPELRDSILSTTLVGDLNSLLKSKSKNVLGHTEDQVDYSKPKSQSGDDSRSSSSSRKSKEMLSYTKEPLDLSLQKPQRRDDPSGSLSLIKQKTTAELTSNSEKTLNHTVDPVEFSKKKPHTGHTHRSISDDSIDATKICQLCDRTFNLRSKMLREYSGPGFSCPVEECNFIFTHKSNLESHIKRHTVINPYAGKVDAKTFAREGNLKSAFQNRREINGANGDYHVCNYCGMPIMWRRLNANAI